MNLPDGFWSGWGPYVAGVVLGFLGWIGRSLLKATNRMTELEAQTESLSEKLDRMHAENIARLLRVEEAQTHMPNRHVVNNMGMRLDGLERLFAGLDERAKSIAAGVSDNSTNIRDVREMMIKMLQIGNRGDQR